MEGISQESDLQKLRSGLQGGLSRKAMTMPCSILAPVEAEREGGWRWLKEPCQMSQLRQSRSLQGRLLGTRRQQGGQGAAREGEGKGEGKGHSGQCA